MTDKSKINQAFKKWKAKNPYVGTDESEATVEDIYTAGYKQSRIDLAENIHVALTFAECGLKDKDYALKLSREIIDKELDEDYWENR